MILLLINYCYNQNFNLYEMYTINEVRNRILDEDIQTRQSLKIGNYSISVGDDDNLLISQDF